MRHTITFGDNLSNRLQLFYIISHFFVNLNEEDRDGSKCFQDILDTTMRTNTTSMCLWVVPQHEIELFNKVVEDLFIVVNISRPQDNQGLFAPERRTSISPLPSDVHGVDRTVST